ncbi:MAG TPA: L-threonylcarbamoyladenylate synthase [Acidimicrobiales bacterium]|jgi:tRNA threonylcarbamoyl adenosine modification protein (Sua5/YciO/YrdC/YwlC family)|nr:L-threonylcarbamoyladenylate synthase [Acidimicrobiales bacterium]
MTTRVLTPDELDDAVALLAGGNVLAVPTDTVYGLAAVVGAAASVGRLSALKQRPELVPIAVLCASVDDARGVATSWPQGALALSALWPGPLTLVVPAPAGLAQRLGSSNSVGVRVPDDAICRALLERTGPLAVTSANLHGAPPATTADEVLAIFEGSGLAGVLDAGTRDGEVSSVVDVTGIAPVIVREGALTRHELRAMLTQS